MLALFYLLLTYMVASVPTGLVLGALLADVDITAHGSGNIGATNANRVLGRRVGALTLAGDFLKGFLPVALAGWVDAPGWYPGAVALVAFAGHCWSAYLCFRGGKGVATSAGAMAALAPVPTLLAALAWGAVVAATRRSSVGALVSIAALPLAVAWLAPAWLWCTGLLCIGVLARHHENIQRLMAGTER